MPFYIRQKLLTGISGARNPIFLRACDSNFCESRMLLKWSYYGIAAVLIGSITGLFRPSVCLSCT